MMRIEEDLKTMCEWYKSRIELMLYKSVDAPHYRKVATTLKADFEKTLVSKISSYIADKSDLNKKESRMISEKLCKIAAKYSAKLFEPEKARVDKGYYEEDMYKFIRLIEVKVSN